MKFTLKNYLLVGIAWGLVSVLIEFGLLRDCFSFGYAPNWCDSPPLMLIHFTLGFPAMLGFLFAMFSGTYLEIDPKTFGTILITIGSVISAIIISFLLAFIGKVILKVRQKLGSNRF